MNHILVTGATGLLGRYIVRDLLLQGHSVAVLARSSRSASADERIVEMIQHWETTDGFLPVPKVLEGNITEQNLGLSDDDQKWVAQNCSAVIHSAASLKFQQVGNEPWDSNLNGTRHVVDLCERLGVESLFYVSTAYVCGKTQVPALETIPDEQVEPRNVYEASKRQAEQVVREANLKQTPTILRPSIIMGDSVTGYTSTFHGPYLPLRLSLALMTPAAVEAGMSMALDPNHLMELMALTGNERKNLVPVDWVSRGIVRVVLNSELHGRTYHLTTENPVTVEQISVSTVNFLDNAFGFRTSGQGEIDSELEDFFTAQMAVYREYWADDPTFDTTNTRLAMPNDPSPVIDAAMLQKMFQFCLDAERQRKSVAVS